MAALRIGVNALYLIPGEVGGTEIYLRSLLRALAAADHENHYLVFTNRETGPDLVPAAANFERIPHPVPARIRPFRILWEQAALPVSALRRRLDVLFNPGFTAPMAAPCPMVTVFHDLQHLRHPEFFRWFDLPFWRFLLRVSAWRSRVLIAISESTRRDLERFYHSPKVAVAPLGADPEFFELAERAAPESAAPYLLCVSTLHPHKNLPRLVRVFARLRERRPELRLVLAGCKGFHTGEVEDTIRILGLEAAVTVTGWIPREQLLALYRSALAFVFPSLFEGFGIPLLEALAAGLPTACSDIEPLRSLAGDAALRFDPADSGAMYEALERLCSDEPLRRRLRAAGPERAREFSWERTAAVTLECLRQAARPTGPR